MQSISEITSTQSQDVSDVMNNVSTMADKINESTEALEYSAENMDEMVGSFKLS
jgi:methyl-accepting chemotaxis protein